MYVASELFLWLKTITNKLFCEFLVLHFGKASLGILSILEHNLYFDHGAKI